MNDTRRRDAARSRQALLAAAAGLFAERGYAGTAIRSVGDRAGVDPALIARYFGGKEGLYRAVLAADPLLEHSGSVASTPPTPARATASASSSAPDGPEGGAPGATSTASPSDSLAGPEEAVVGLVRRALDHWTSAGASAAAQNVFRPEVDDAAREATRERVSTLLPPLRGAAGHPDPELAAELAVALLFGVGVARDAGTLARLSSATPDELAGPLTAALVAALGIPDHQ